MVTISREAKNYFVLVLFGGTYGAALDYAHTHGGAIEYPEGTHHERGILTFAVVYSFVPQLVSWYRMATESFIELEPAAAPPASSDVDGNKGEATTSTTVLPTLEKVIGQDEADALRCGATILPEGSNKTILGPGSMYSLAVKGAKAVPFTTEENARRRFKRLHPLAPWTIAFPATAVLFTSGYLLTAYGWNRLPSLAIAATLAAPTLYLYKKWDGAFHGLVCMIGAGLCGASTEAFLNSYVKSMTYQTNDILGIPFWLFWIYALNYSTYGQLTRFLLEPKHRVKVFEGVDALPHKWARTFYKDHVGLPKGTRTQHE